MFFLQNQFLIFFFSVLKLFVCIDTNETADFD